MSSQTNDTRGDRLIWGHTLKARAHVFINADTGETIDIQEVCRRLGKYDDLSRAAAPTAYNCSALLDAIKAGNEARTERYKDEIADLQEQVVSQLGKNRDLRQRLLEADAELDLYQQAVQP